MHPYMTSKVAEAIIADRLASAEAYRLAKSARVARRSHKTGRGWQLRSRRHTNVELMWPDGVRSVVSSAPESAATQDSRAHGLAGSRR